MIDLDAFPNVVEGFSYVVSLIQSTVRHMSLGIGNLKMYLILCFEQHKSLDTKVTMDAMFWKNIDYYFSVVETVEEFGEPVEKDSRAPRGNRPVFECYWNGRLIPYTYIDV